eukprot:631378-Amphidinium_carterae.4
MATVRYTMPRYTMGEHDVELERMMHIHLVAVGGDPSIAVQCWKDSAADPHWSTLESGKPRFGIDYHSCRNRGSFSVVVHQGLGTMTTTDAVLRSALCCLYPGCSLLGKWKILDAQLQCCFQECIMLLISWLFTARKVEDT